MNHVIGAMFALIAIFACVGGGYIGMAVACRLVEWRAAAKERRKDGVNDRTEIDN